MDRFITGNTSSWAQLKRRAWGRCVRLASVELPPGAAPRRAAVAFETSPQTGAARLYVTRGVRYRGPHADMRRWLESGERVFPSFRDLRAWIQSDLAAAYLDARKCPRCNTQNAALNSVCHHCADPLVVAPRLAGVAARVEQWTQGRAATLLTGSASVADAATELGLPSSLVQAAFKSLAETRRELGLAADGQMVLLFQYPVQVRGQPKSLVSRVHAFLTKEGRRSEEMRALARQRAVLSYRLECRRRDHSALQDVERSLLEQGRRTCSPTPQRELAQRIREVRRGEQRIATIESVLTQQIDILSAHLHHMALSANGTQGPTLSAEKLASQAATAEAVVQQLRDAANLANAIEVASAEIDSPQEQTAILQEFAAHAASPKPLNLGSGEMGQLPEMVHAAQRSTSQAPLMAE